MTEQHRTRYAILCYDSEETVCAWSEEKEASVMEDLAVVQRKLAAEGRLGPVARLQPTTKAKTLRKGKDTRVIDGPFAETKELIAGYSIWEVASMEEAVEWVKRSPVRDTEVELRKILDAEDFDESFAAEIAAAEIAAAEERGGAEPTDKAQ